MNSTSLQANFPKVYREFFSNCQQVMSATNSFVWIGEYAGFYEGLTLTQKLPLRTYVGLEKIKEQGVVIEPTYLAYVPYQKKFIHCTLDEQIKSKLKDFLKDKLSGYKIHILAELPLGHSLGTAGAMSADLAGLVYWLHERRMNKNVENIKSWLEKNFEGVFQLAWQILSLNKSGKSNGAATFAAMSSSAYPIIFYSQANYHYWTRKLEDILGVSEVPSWPFDFGLIYSGNRINNESVISAAKEAAKKLEEVAKFAQQNLDQDKRKDYRQTYLAMLDILTTSALANLVKLFQKGAKPEVLEAFFGNLNQFQNLLRMLEVNTPAIDKIYSEIHQIASKDKNQVGSGVKITGVGKGGDLLFAVPFGQFRDGIDKIITGLRKETKEEIWLDYASWIDGFDTEGLRLEQDIELGILSKFISHDSYLMQIFAGQNQFSSVITSEKLVKEIKNYDLLLDKTTGKVLVRGKSVDSKELPSQKAVVEIVSQLLANKDQKLSHNQLPKAYSSNRYDLQGKITSPLEKLIKARAKKTLILKVEGGMYHDYSLTLVSSNLQIGVVEKVM